MSIQQGDFITIHYTGKTKDGIVFDTTDPSVATDAGLDPKKATAVTTKVGSGFVVSGLDASFIGQEVGKPYSVELEPMQAFGRKDAKLIELVSASKFKQADMQPYVGMHITLDERNGVVRRVGGGRVLVDFNHPLSGQTIVYDVTISAIVTDAYAQAKAVLANQGFGSLQTSFADGVLTISLPSQLPAQFTDALKAMLVEAVEGVTDVTFSIVANKKTDDVVEENESKTDETSTPNVSEDAKKEAQ